MELAAFVMMVGKGPPVNFVVEKSGKSLFCEIV